MASENMKLGVALVLLMAMLICHKATAQSGCTTALLALAPCLNYITGNSTTPPSSCCSQLSSVVQSQPQCLCSALNGGASSLGITINQTRALSLPAACNVKTPPVSRCNAASGPAAPPVSYPVSPVPAPAPAPGADSSKETPDTPDTSSTPLPTTPLGTGSKAVPTTEASTSDGSTMKLPLTLTLFIASYISLITLST